MEFELEREKEGEEVKEREYVPKPVEFEKEDIVEALLESLKEMSEEEKQELSDELLTIVTSSGVELLPPEKNAFMALIKGHLVGYTFRNAIKICMERDARKTLQIIKKYA